MMDQHTEFVFDRERQLALVGLRPEHGDDLQRLLKILVFGPDFQFLVAEANDGEYRGKIISRINEFAGKFDLPAARIQLENDTYPDIATLEQELQSLARDHRLIHIEGGEFWFDIPRWQNLNVRREAIAQSVPARLLFWLNTEPIRLFIQYAPDCWAWRSGVFSFLYEPQIQPSRMAANFPKFNNFNLLGRTRRIAVIQDWLSGVKDGSAEIKLPLLEEMAWLYMHLGKLEDALEIYQHQALPLAMASGQLAHIPVLYGSVADVFLKMGKYANAIDIIKTEVLPRFTKLGDRSNLLVAQTRLATLLRFTEQHVAALDVLNDLVLPMARSLGDDRQGAIAISEIAITLNEMGREKESLQILEQQALPAFLNLGDKHSIALTKSRIASILLNRNESQEALRILQKDVLPIYADLGESADVFKTQILIAQILRRQGAVKQALALLRQQLQILRPPDELSLESGLANFEISRCLVDENQCEEAIKELETKVIPAFGRYQTGRNLQVAKGLLNDLKQQVKPTLGTSLAPSTSKTKDHP